MNKPGFVIPVLAGAGRSIEPDTHPCGHDEPVSVAQMVWVTIF